MSENSLIIESMLKVMRDVGAIKKEKTNTSYGSGGFKYRGIDDVYNALNQVMAEHGVITTCEKVEMNRSERTSSKGALLTLTMIEVNYIFTASDGSSIKSWSVGEAMDSGDKGCNKCMSIAHKYALLQCFMIPTEDLIDPDAESHQLSSDESLSRVSPQPKFDAPSEPKELHKTAIDLYLSMIKSATSTEGLGKIYQEYKARNPAKKSYDELTKACAEKKREILSAKASEIIDEETGELI